MLTLPWHKGRNTAQPIELATPTGVRGEALQGSTPWGITTIVKLSNQQQLIVCLHCQGTRGQILPQPLGMQPQEGSAVKDPKSSAPQAPLLVLWLPATKQPQPKGRAQRQKKSEDQVESHIQPGSDALLARGWWQLQQLQQV